MRGLVEFVERMQSGGDPLVAAMAWLTAGRSILLFTVILGLALVSIVAIYRDNRRIGHLAAGVAAAFVVLIGLCVFAPDEAEQRRAETLREILAYDSVSVTRHQGYITLSAGVVADTLRVGRVITVDERPAVRVTFSRSRLDAVNAALEREGAYALVPQR